MTERGCLHKLYEFFNRESRIPDQAPQKSRVEFSVIRDREHARRVGFTKDHVTATLAVKCPTRLFKRLSRFTPTDDRELWHRYNVIRSTWLGGFVRSILSCCASNQPSAASRTFASASSRVAPCDQQPGKAGTCETKPDCSPGSVITLNFMRQVYRAITGKTLLVDYDLKDSNKAVDTGLAGAMPEVLDQLEELLLRS